MVDRIYHGALVVTGPRDAHPFVGDVGIDGDTIAFVRPTTGAVVGGGSAPDTWPPASHPAAEHVDATGHVLLPGLVNGHLHPTPALLRTALAATTIDHQDGHPLADGLYAALTADRETLRLSAKLAITEAISSGTTALCLHEYLDPVVAAEVAADLGIPATVALHPEPGGTAWRDTLRQVQDTGCSAMLAGVNENDPDHTPEYLRELVTHAADLGIRVHTHVSETTLRHETTRARTGRSPIRYYQALGLLDHLYAVHCTAVEPADIDLLADHRVPVVLTPSSEALLGDGTPPLPALLAAGARLALGTDGSAWAGSEDLLAELRATALLTRARWGPEAVDGAQLIELATLGGADVLDTPDTRGAIEPGRRADLVLLDARRPGLRPLATNGPLSTARDVLAFAATGADVVETTIGGRVRYRRDGPGLLTGDELAELDERARRVWRDSGAATATSW
ncbi:amidohydrolase family protein [Actinoalloteichus caeruleus]|uniref:amidohydrolase family protein n=2 Tax=Actinoalloteichus cyanogriseus TaxID=2893586 RepID=UPI0004C20A3D|nr:amidohydrolase family protein [Actinoalloteichus caeruleus]